MRLVAERLPLERCDRRKLVTRENPEYGVLFCVQASRKVINGQEGFVFSRSYKCLRMRMKRFQERRLVTRRVLAAEPSTNPVCGRKVLCHFRHQFYAPSQMIVVATFNYAVSILEHAFVGV